MGRRRIRCKQLLDEVEVNVLPVIEIERARSLSVVKSLWKRLRTDYNMNVFILVLTQ